MFQPRQAEVSRGRLRMFQSREAEDVPAEGGFPVCSCATAQRRGEEEKIKDKIVNKNRM